MSGLEPVQAAPATSAGLATGELAVEFGAALERQTPILLASARALLRNEADARDLVQITLEIASRRISELRDPFALRSWLLAIQAREAFRLRRRLARFIQQHDDGRAQLGTKTGCIFNRVQPGSNFLHCLEWIFFRQLGQQPPGLLHVEQRVVRFPFKDFRYGKHGSIQSLRLTGLATNMAIISKYGNQRCD